MNRDPGLLVDILEFLEEIDDSRHVPVSIDGHSEDKLEYHLYLCVDAGFIARQQVPAGAESSTAGYRLTWKGHVALAAYQGHGVSEFDQF